MYMKEKLVIIKMAKTYLRAGLPGSPLSGNPDGTPGKEGFPAHGYSNRNIRQFPPDRRTHCGRPAPMFPEMPPVFSLEKIFQGA